MKFDIKSIALIAILPLISSFSPEAGKTIRDGQEALVDGHLSEDEALKLIGDTIDTAKSFWKEGAQVLDDTRELLIVLHTNVETKISKLVADIKAIQ